MSKPMTQEQVRQAQIDWCYNCLPPLRGMANGPLIADLVVHAVNETLEHSTSHVDRAKPLLSPDEIRVMIALVMKGCEMMYAEAVQALIAAVEREELEEEMDELITRIAARLRGDDL